MPTRERHRGQLVGSDRTEIAACDVTVNYRDGNIALVTIVNVHSSLPVDLYTLTINVMILGHWCHLYIRKGVLERA